MTEKPGEAPDERPLWNLNRDEQRILIITFVGGLGSIVAGAGIIGGAIAIGRYVRHAGLAPWGETTVEFLVLIPVMLIGLRAFIRRGHVTRRERRFLRVFMWILLPIWCVGASITLLVWIGMAAGIH